jgi:pimeloyl-ACP methyl ester carboxylesterase
LNTLIIKQREIFQTKAAQSPHFFYNDLEPDEAAGWERKLKAQSGVPFIEPVSYAPFEDPAWAGRCAFIYCTKDNAITPDMQARYIANYQVPKNLVVRIEASHSPFLSKPEATASAITELTKRFLAMMVE